MNDDTSTPCGCSDSVPCLQHVVQWADRQLASAEAMAAELATVQSDVDMAGPEDDRRHLLTAEERVWGLEHLTGWLN